MLNSSGCYSDDVTAVLLRRCGLATGLTGRIFVHLRLRRRCRRNGLCTAPVRAMVLPCGCPPREPMQASPNSPLSTAGVDNTTAVSLMGLRLARLDRHHLLDHVFECLRVGQGGWLVTANLDFLRRYVRDRQSRELYDAADVRVADGMPLVWACKLQGQPLPERVPGSSLVWLLAERAARE